ncbi:MAG TPA: hypothetical protein VF092_19385 [Longimicrobium sp.]
MTSVAAGVAYLLEERVGTSGFDGYSTADATAASAVQSTVAEKPGQSDCDGICPYRPYLVVPASFHDKGDRPTTQTPVLGPDSPSVFFEMYSPSGEGGERVQHPQIGGEYTIVVRIENQGNAPAVGLCVDYLEWTRTEGSIHVYTFSPGLITRGGSIMDDSSVEIRSPKWIPKGHDGAVNGDVIVRAFDVFDPYLDTGYKLYVTNDRHLAHRSFTAA